MPKGDKLAELSWRAYKAGVKLVREWAPAITGSQEGKRGAKK